jgi:hypothetical protein
MPIWQLPTQSAAQNSPAVTMANQWISKALIRATANPIAKPTATGTTKGQSDSLGVKSRLVLRGLSEESISAPKIPSLARSQEAAPHSVIFVTEGCFPNPPVHKGLAARITCQ